jgi:tartrate/fumarate subfamily iron-sulfur-dependent hydro-lyase alpha chain/tartrate/fumarate subfamily iron-sulfur-dependent hydro-lyase beta chain
MSTVATDIQQAVEDAAAYLYVWALKDIPQDLRDALRDARERETSTPGQRVLDTIIRNVSIADEQTTLVCQDTGIAVYYCRVGEHFPLHPARIYEALYDGTERATVEHPLRSNTVHTLTRENTGQNVGYRVPIVHWDFVSGWDGLDVKCVPKGSGSENMSFLKMCVPADGVAGIKRFVLDSIVGAGGKPCPPGIVGVGIGGRAPGRHAQPRLRGGEARGGALRPPERDRDRADGPGRGRHRPPVPRRARGHAHDPQPRRGELPVLGRPPRDRAHRCGRDHRLRPGGLSVAERRIQFPADEETIRSLHAGDSVLVDGHIIGIRDRTQIRIFDEGVEPPMDLRGAFLLHTAPGVRKVGPGKYEPVSIGTTTSARMVRFTEPLGRDYGVRAICGKGGLPDEAIEPMKKHGMVYFAIVGGAAALETTQIEEIEEVAWEELMPECLWKFRVKDFGPLTVGIDAHGTSLFHDVQEAAKKRLEDLYARL